MSKLPRKSRDQHNVPAGYVRWEFDISNTYTNPTTKKRHTQRKRETIVEKPELVEKRYQNWRNAAKQNWSNMPYSGDMLFDIFKYYTGPDFNRAYF